MVLQGWCVKDLSPRPKPFGKICCLRRLISALARSYLIVCICTCHRFSFHLLPLTSVHLRQQRYRPTMLEKPLLYARLFLWACRVLYHMGRQKAIASWNRSTLGLLGSSPPVERDRNIVIVGANFAGYHCAKILTDILPLNSRYKVVVVEPNSHFQFTWVLPRFCVVKGHEHKAYVPYGGQLRNAPEGSVEWIRDRVVDVSTDNVKLQNGQHVSYDYLVIATGSEIDGGLPTRANTTEKREAVRLLQEMQQRIEAAGKIVVVGGGAAGVELTADAQHKYPRKKITLVHSRSAVMHRFGKGLQKAALEALETLGCEVVLNDRVVSEDAAAKKVTLKSGRVIECDLFINCTGQKPASGFLKRLAPGSITETGNISVKPTLQIADDNLPNIYVCGDVADTKTPNPNARSASRQASVVADNILLETQGKLPRYTYKSDWADGQILLTLGLERAMMHCGDGKAELLIETKEKEEELMAARAWTGLGEKPYEDAYMDAENAKSNESAV
ncbi:hypothetical protein B0I35DRAFT_426319 [Stachybotrys elegans]|uniref:FAD/NAD(P)-binding domain-containing protein n=1 Tax=Stachybotrys elegans TaxID=80388 RepID=A0A8K0SW54_9HYPO|nr:hypothetical protein B0I35DRAFT_426319 [Stachybotrys elegans]